MVDIVELKTSIYNTLNSLLKTFEFGHVPKKEAMPYITYQLSTSGENDVDNEDALNFLLIVTALDHNQERDTTVVENLTNGIMKTLHAQNIIEPTFYWQAKRLLVNPGLPTPDEFTFRRELQFTLETYLSEVE
jgi:hypothetical protein